MNKKKLTQEKVAGVTIGALNAVESAQEGDLLEIERNGQSFKINAELLADLSNSDLSARGNNVFWGENSFVQPISSVAPTENSHLTTKEYVDSQQLTYSAPLLKNDLNLSLNLGTDLMVSDGKLILNLANNSIISQIQQQIDSLVGSLLFIGQIDESSESIDLDLTKLTQFVESKKSREPRHGDCINSNDNVLYIFSDSQWNRAARLEISIATTTTPGLIKFGNNDGELYDTGDGLAKVVGFENLVTTDSLSTSLAGKADTSSVVTISGTQSVTGRKTFTSIAGFSGSQVSKGNLSILSNNNQACYISFAVNLNSNSSDRHGYIGFGSSDANFSIFNEKTGGIFLTNKKWQYTETIEFSDNKDIVNKAYVDQLLTKIKDVAAQATDFEQFKAALQEI